MNLKTKLIKYLHSKNLQSFKKQFLIKENDSKQFSFFTPRKIVHFLDQHIISQEQAKRSIAIAFRNRWRRKNLDPQLKKEIMPKNILLSGPTGNSHQLGCGKTQISRRIANLCKIPFLKVEASKYTQVGYVGKDVSSIIYDLAKIAMNNMTQLLINKRKQSQIYVEQIINKIITIFLLGMELNDPNFEKKLSQVSLGLYDNRTITIYPLSIDLIQKIIPQQFPIPHNFVSHIISKSTATIKYFKQKMKEQFMQKINIMIQEIDINRQIIKKIQEEGVVYIDQIDKIVSPKGLISNSKNVSTDGVQRDLLPIVEGTIVSTKIGDVKTDHMLFIASGAFNSVKPTDLIPQLYGRFPVKVQLQSLNQQQFFRILTQTKYNLPYQQIKLMEKENVTLVFERDAVRKLANIAFQANINHQNIGVRRLHQVIQLTMQKISFQAPQRAGQTIYITEKLVQDQCNYLMKKISLQKYLL